MAGYSVDGAPWLVSRDKSPLARLDWMILQDLCGVLEFEALARLDWMILQDLCGVLEFEALARLDWMILQDLCGVLEFEAFGIWIPHAHRDSHQPWWGDGNKVFACCV